MPIRQFFLAFLFSVLASIASANSEPTYDETIDFIKEKAGVRKSNDNIYFLQSISENSKCQLEQRNKQYATKKTNYVREGLTYEYVDLFSLRDLDPTRVKVSNEHVLLFVREDKKKIEREVITYPTAFQQYNICHTFEGYVKNERKCSKTETITMASIETFNPEVNLPKLEKAFKHLIKLCGGKGELF